MEKNITLSEFSASGGRKYDTVYRRAKKKFPAEMWGKDSVLSAEHIRALSGKSGGSAGGNIRRKNKGMANVEKPAVAEVAPPATLPEAPGAPDQQTTQAGKQSNWPVILDVSISVILIAVVLLHSALIWYDCAALWDTAGAIGGGAVFLVVLAAVLLSFDSGRYGTSEAALYFVFVVDCAAWWVHFPVFRTPVVPDSVTGVLCGFLCACSFIALYLFRAKNIEQ